MISVAIITLNEEDRIVSCLKSLDFADEIVVVDSGSKDNTVSVAKSLGCKVLFQEWLGYARQKQYAVDHCKNDWVLILDADERIPAETSEKIESIISDSGHKYTGFSFCRKNFFHKRWIKHCGWYPNRVLRLVNRRKGRFSNSLVHEWWASDGAVKNLDLCIEHHSFRNYADFINKMQTYSTLASLELLEKGKSATWLTPISHGTWMFFKTYVIKKGFLDGFDGLVISLMNAMESFMKYAKLREIT